MSLIPVLPKDKKSFAALCEEEMAIQRKTHLAEVYGQKQSKGSKNSSVASTVRETEDRFDGGNQQSHCRPGVKMILMSRAKRLETSYFLPILLCHLINYTFHLQIDTITLCAQVLKQQNNTGNRS